MGSSELLEQVRQLRNEGRSPRQIARALGVPRSTVAPLVRAIAAKRGAEAEPEVVGCWVNAGWSQGLCVDESRGWVDEGSSRDGIGGLVSVLLARRHRFDKVSMCGYLTDVYCLGVKNVLGPDVTDELALRRFLPVYYASYPDGWQEAPIDLAQHLVFGAVEYARGLGFEPVADFARVADHLGGWQGPPAITFGKDGKPFFMSGPRDNPRDVIDTLNRTVGRPPKFGYVVGQESPLTIPTGSYRV